MEGNWPRKSIDIVQNLKLKYKKMQKINKRNSFIAFLITFHLFKIKSIYLILKKFLY